MDADREARDAARRKRYHERLALETCAEKELRLAKQREQYQRRKSKSAQSDTSTPQPTGHESNSSTIAPQRSGATHTLDLQGSPEHYQPFAEIPTQESELVLHQTDPSTVCVSSMATDRERRNSTRRQRYHESLALETPEEKEMRLSKQREQYQRRKLKSKLSATSAPQQAGRAGDSSTSVPRGSHATQTPALQGSAEASQDCSCFPTDDIDHVQHRDTGGSLAERNASNARRRDTYRSQREAGKSGYGRASIAAAKKKLEFASVNTPHTLGLPEKICGHCGALAWPAEQTTRQRQTNAWGLSLCCGEGKVELPMLRETPAELQGLLDSDDTASASFRLNIRAYNTIFAFTSMGGQVDKDINTGHGPYVFRLNGQTYHLIGSLLPTEGSAPKFAQLYMFDANDDISGRINVFSEESQLDPIIVTLLQRLFDRENALAKMFHEARDRFSESDYMPVTLRIISARTSDGRETDMPDNAYEFGGLVPGDDFRNPRDIIVDHQSSGLQRISLLHPCYMALQYPILFPYGEDGYRLNILHRGLGQQTPTKHNTVTMRQYYAFRLQVRSGEGHTLLKGGRLLLQYVVDAWTCIEQNRLNWVLGNQATLRSELYNNIVDAVSMGDTCPQSVGKRIILPSSFVGSPRYMHQNYQDALAVCRHFGHPDLFITFTCNPKWPEIGYLLEYTHQSDSTVRPDVIARVFKLKLDALIEDLQKNSVLGRVVAVVYTIEFQKRGLPHAHIVVWLADTDKCNTPSEVEALISAEIPDKDSDPLAYAVVSEFMIHGPCGVAYPTRKCTKNNVCTKHFPKAFQTETTLDLNGYPVYRRREDGRSVVKNGVSLDNRYVVPYNRGLSVKYQAHINVEWCNRALAIKYLFKYISKGPDRATIVIEPANQPTLEGVAVERPAVNEVDNYLSCRYVSAAESCWRIFQNPIHYRKPTVQRLYFHLENQQQVRYQENETLPTVLQNTDPESTMFVQWMRANGRFEAARGLTYVDFPSKFCWDTQAKCWNPRQLDITVIGRLMFAHPLSGERFYLRMLLNTCKGAQSFEDLRTFDGVLYGTYKEACFHRGLLESDAEWHDALAEAAFHQTSSQLREFFSAILLFCEVCDALELWNRHWESLSDDIEYTQQRICSLPTLKLTDERKKAFALYEIDLLLKKSGKSLQDFPTLPPLDPSLVRQCNNRLLQEELAYNRTTLAAEHSRMFPMLNAGQRTIYNLVLKSVENGTGGMYFVYGHGGTGKTFLWQTLIAKLRSEGLVVLVVASSGIASLLIDGGRTAHSRFKIPLDIEEHSTCDIKRDTMLSDLICKTDLIVWDEAPMNHRFVFEAVDKTLRDLLRSVDIDAEAKIFGGKTIMLGGDFRQILPVIPKGGREDVVLASINKSHLWTHCTVLKLDENMRLQKDSPKVTISGEAINFCDWIIQVGDGRAPCHDLTGEGVHCCWIEIPKEILIPTQGDGLAAIISAIYSDIACRYLDSDYLSQRAILTPMNEDVHKINKLILGSLPGESRVYQSSDYICKGTTNYEDQLILYPTEYLNSLNFNGIPKHELELKIGAPIMLLRNIRPSKGLCNGTRLIVTQMTKWSIEGKIVSGNNIGRRAFIPRIIMSPTESALPFTFKRRQFPVALCYAMTINKSQGQTVSNVGLYLPNPVFTHGQLYVAISRVTSPTGLKVVIEDSDTAPPGYTRNVVYKEVFTGL